MQNPKPRSGSSETPQKISPRARTLKLNSVEVSTTSGGPGNRTPVDRSPKVSERRSSRSPACEGKRSTRVLELESQISQLQDDLQKAKDQLVASEIAKIDALSNEEASKNELLAISSKLEESQKQLSELIASKETHVAELRCISEQKDEAWKSQLEAVQKQHSVDSVALVSALDEIEKLKIRLEMVTESYDAQSKSRDSTEAELCSTREKLSETLTLLEITKNELVVCKESEAHAKDTATETMMQLEAAKDTIDALRSDAIKATEAYNCIVSELDHSRAHASSLEGLVKKLEADLAQGSIDKACYAVNDHMSVDSVVENKEMLDAKHLEAELDYAKCEVARLKSALEAAEIKYNEEKACSSAQIISTQELVERIRSSSSLREAELDEELKKAKGDFEELRANLMEMEADSQDISEENECLKKKLESIESLVENDREKEKEIKKLREEVEELRTKLMEQEMVLQNTSKQNAMLKAGAEKREADIATRNAAIAAEVEASHVAEQEARAMLFQVMDEADKSNKKVARVCEQLEAAQAVNAEMESELRRLKVQSDQWRKAAEAAASMLSTGGNGKLVERTRSLDTNFSPVPGRISSGYLNEYDNGTPKKKNGNMLQKIGVLWKKQQK